ncbi:MAG: phosphodiester glycosidase family protein [Gloeobacteraceae cyanobacterium ES-bin-144]|nr:phosphodiester glycosidase family protein [Verrucomicrobiales bacterium]
MTVSSALAALFLALALLLPAAVVEESITHAGVKFRVVRIPADQVKLVWKDSDGVPYRSFDRVQAAYAKQGKTIKFLMNAGIFEPGGTPSGLHIEAWQKLRPLNLADAPGNFFLKPNGVCSFGVSNLAGPFIGTCEAWQKRIEIASHKRSLGVEDWALQSGPMLLIAGQRHPTFRPDSNSKLARNGVGTDAQERFVFAITEPGQMVNFWDFAGLFLSLGCKDALFLDGDISQMAVNPNKPIESNQFAAIFVAAE